MKFIISIINNKRLIKKIFINNEKVTTTKINNQYNYNLFYNSSFEIKLQNLINKGITK